MSKASGPDGITARHLKDAAPVIAKPITYLVNLTMSTGLIPSEWKDARVKPIFKPGVRNNMNIYLPWCQRLWSRLFKYNSWLFLTEHDLLS